MIISSATFSSATAQPTSQAWPPTASPPPAYGSSASVPPSPNRPRPGKLSAPVTALPDELQAAFRAQMTALPSEIKVLPKRDLAWLMAELQTHHRSQGRTLSAAMVEALAAAHRHGGGIAVSSHDVGPNLRAAADADHIPFHIL